MASFIYKKLSAYIRHKTVAVLRQTQQPPVVGELVKPSKRPSLMNKGYITGGFPAAALWTFVANKRKKRNYRAEPLPARKTLEKTPLTGAWRTNAAHDRFHAIPFNFPNIQ
jgi:hypothetical protein